MSEGIVGGFQRTMKASATALSKASLIRIDVVFLALFLTVLVALVLRPPSSVVESYGASSLVRCSLNECHHKGDAGVKMKVVLEEAGDDQGRTRSGLGNGEKIETPSFLKDIVGETGTAKIGVMNMDGDDLSEWGPYGETIPIRFDQVSELFEWKDLFPEWIDEEEESDVPLCPEIPFPDFDEYPEMDLIVAKLPCKYPETGWNRDLFRLQVHLAAARMAVEKGKKKHDHNSGNGSSGRRTGKVVVLSKCRPMPEILRCDDLARKKNDWWYYEVDVARLEQKVSLPVGSCRLSLPLWGQEINEVYDLSNILSATKTVRREAYATVLHSSESYVCGAITLARSLLATGTKRDLVLLLDASISQPKRDALTAAGWRLRLISRIRNPKAERYSYNEYNYSKFRLWQLTDYDKVIFIDADILVLRNLDLLFHFPQMSAVGNDNSIFNSGIMVLEPSNCTFKLLMNSRDEIVSYNGGDQGYLNEIFVWWHRLPRRVNFLKNYWSNTTAERSVKDQLFGSDPPKLYGIHYLGWKPWLCYRDYDCNWDVEDSRVYASDVAHARWWRFADEAMDDKLRTFCGLTLQRRTELNWERRKARLMKSGDGHWKINVTDPRRLKSNLVG
ncbi:hypothetical protein MLD38_000930 [Melastoma candidum]|uniref:Uncharacterized protein n=1 Tax=Melastoma candidum TaxID=119954 RepID=A0ACB9SBN6_9MYRT|nr:hypothetical protein MLD38_000930 [Melastoma candidum]